MAAARPMRIAIVGEGPTGLVCLAKLLHNLSISPPPVPIDIVWFRYRDKYMRRHVINISKEFLEELESILVACSKCLGSYSANSPDPSLSMSIRTLEYLLNEHIKMSPEFTKVSLGSQFDYDKTLEGFDHIFFCDGVNSKGRINILFNKIPFNPIMFNYGEPILILYSGLGPKNINESWTPELNMKSFKKYLKNSNAREYGISLQIIYDLVSIFYNVRKSASKFEGAPFEPRDLWATGFETLNELKSIFIELSNFVKEFILAQSAAVLFNTLRKGGAYITPTQEELGRRIVETPQLIGHISHAIFNLIEHHIKDPTNIIFNPILPKIQSYGIALGEENMSILRFAKKVGETSVYLVGDSANAFPPGYSLEISMRGAYDFIHVFYSRICLGDSSKHFQTYTIETLECEHKNEFERGAFLGGYPSEDVENNGRPKTLVELKALVESSITSVDSFLDEYNMYQFQIFMFYSKMLLCKGSFQLGGTRRRSRRGYRSVPKCLSPQRATKLRQPHGSAAKVKSTRRRKNRGSK